MTIGPQTPAGTGASGAITLADIQNALLAGRNSVAGQSSPIFTYLRANSQTLLPTPSSANLYQQALQTILPSEFNTPSVQLPQQYTSRLITNSINPLTAAIATITGQIGGGYIPPPGAKVVQY
jgi:hypothetical protein